jgi:hypothetical protein
MVNLMMRWTMSSELCVRAYPPARKCCHDFAGSQVVVVDVDIEGRKAVSAGVSVKGEYPARSVTLKIDVIHCKFVLSSLDFQAHPFTQPKYFHHIVQFQPECTHDDNQFFFTVICIFRHASAHKYDQVFDDINGHLASTADCLSGEYMGDDFNPMMCWQS